MACKIRHQCSINSIPCCCCFTRFLPFRGCECRYYASNVVRTVPQATAKQHRMHTIVNGYCCIRHQVRSHHRNRQLPRKSPHARSSTKSQNIPGISWDGEALEIRLARSLYCCRLTDPTGLVGHIFTSPETAQKNNNKQTQATASLRSTT